MEEQSNDFNELKQNVIEDMKICIDYIDILRDHAYATLKEAEHANSELILEEIFRDFEKCANRIIKETERVV